jgi:DNA repair protein RecO (recombination protein O)
MQQTLKSPALVLYSMRWSETSKIVHLFTSEKGYLKAIARGALRPKSSFRGTLENLNHIEVILNIKEGRGLQMVNQVSLLDPFSNVRENLEATSVAFAISELLRALVHENEASQPLFQFTIRTLEELNVSATPPPILFLIRYLLYLSEYLGFGWNLGVCNGCKKIPKKFPLRAEIVNGSVYCPDCVSLISLKTVSLSFNQWQLLQQLRQASPTTLQQSDIPSQPLIDLLLSHLNYHTEQNLQLKSLKLYQR